MTTEFRLPELGENIQSGKVISVLVSVGETIALDQPVIEVETEKALIEVPSSVEGRIAEIRLEPGDDAEVGATILVVEESGAEPAPAEAEGGAGGGVEEPPSEADAPRTAAPAEPSAPAAAPPAAAPEPVPGAGTPAAPAARRIAREAGVDIREVPGSGAGGRISPQDVREFAAARGAAPGAPAWMRAPVQLPDLARWGEVERAPMSGIRRAASANLARAWALIPHVTQCEKADVSELENLRKKFAPEAEAAGGKLTITAVLIKVLASALGAFPQFNASVDAAAGEIVLRRYAHVGVAVDTESGLLVPVIRDADKKSVIELSVELGEAAGRARSRRLAPDDMEGGSITITNLGGFGGTYFTPIVKWPEVAILGVSRARMEPVWTGEAFAPRLMLPLMVSYDHRVIDGADGVRFLRWVADALEKPAHLNLGG